MSAKTRRIALTVNGEAVTREVPVRLNLVDFLRHELGFTGSHVGCEQGACGACTVLLDEQTVRGCLVLAVQADGGVVETIEGAGNSGLMADLQAKFHSLNALQCGF
ncbi:MAG: 2Fe-2S iron-sulfur cluster-binding protein, partial [Alphaproteobacteria bacterium]|nr:2Fe-2S iron-sulfur cluster-binding protein [Alphaproteobacteria bacterium]